MKVLNKFKNSDKLSKSLIIVTIITILLFVISVNLSYEDSWLFRLFAGIGLGILCGTVWGYVVGCEESRYNSSDKQGDE